MEQLTVIELIAYFFFKFIEDNIYAHTNFLSPREAYIKPKRLRSDIYRPNVLRYMITVGSWEHRPPAEKADDAFILSLLYLFFLFAQLFQRTGYLTHKVTLYASLCLSYRIIKCLCI